MTRKKLSPYETEVLIEIREIIGTEAEELFKRYIEVIKALDEEPYPDEIAENIIRYSNKGVSESEWLSHIKSINEFSKRTFDNPPNERVTPTEVKSDRKSSADKIKRKVQGEKTKQLKAGYKLKRASRSFGRNVRFKDINGNGYYKPSGSKKPKSYKKNIKH